YFVNSGEWRRRLFWPRRDARNALDTLLYYLRLRKSAPAQDLYNGLQRLAYTAVILFGILSVLSGLAIYKPVQLRAFGLILGGYARARGVHLILLVLFALFTVGHLLMVSLHPRSLGEMVTGGKPHD